MIQATLFLFLIVTFGYGVELIKPIPIEKITNEKKALLGKKLFLDPRLSKDNTISCGSCHILNQGGDDNLPFSFGVGGKAGALNSPTVYNSKFNFVQFWDGRAKNLSQQAIGPIHNPLEMDSNFPQILSKLNKDDPLKKEFLSVYSDGLNEKNIIDAIVAFENTLTTPNSKFDKYLKKEGKLSQKELEGYRLFKSYGCISCHNGVNIGGNLYQSIGVVTPFRQNDLQQHRFKVPSLRNITQTAPYLHDGSIATLKGVILLMFEHQLGITPTQEDIDKITAFLKSLEGEIPAIAKIK